MALNAYEEITIINNTVSPDATTLQELVHQIGTQFAEDFMKSYKIFPTTEVIDDPENPGTDITVSINQEATSYSQTRHIRRLLSSELPTCLTTRASLRRPRCGGRQLAD